MRDTIIKTKKVTCTECNGTGAKSACCVAGVDKGVIKTSCKHCKNKCKTVDCLICRGKGFVNLLLAAVLFLLFSFNLASQNFYIKPSIGIDGLISSLNTNGYSLNGDGYYISQSEIVTNISLSIYSGQINQSNVYRTYNYGVHYGIGKRINRELLITGGLIYLKGEDQYAVGMRFNAEGWIILDSRTAISSRIFMSTLFDASVQYGLNLGIVYKLNE